MKSEQVEKHWKLIFIGLIAAAAIERKYFGEAFSDIFAAMAAALLVLKLYDGLGNSYRRVQAARRRSQRGINLYKEIIPPGLRGLVLTQALTLGECFNRLVRLTPRSVKLENACVKSSSFSLSQGDISTLIIPMAVIVTLTDIPLDQLIVAAAKFDHAMLIHLVVLSAAIWGLIWVIGDRLAVKTMNHYVHDGCIRLRVGHRWDCKIPVSAVARCVSFDYSSQASRKRLGMSKQDLWRVTPIDKPNILIELDEKFSNEVHIVKMGSVAAQRRYLAVYVDRPNSFIRAIINDSQAAI